MFIAQYNIAWMRFPFEDPRFDDFKQQLEEVHLQAEAHPGFVWRYKGEATGDGYIQSSISNPLIMGNLSIWRSLEDIKDFTFHNEAHMKVMRKKRKWFEPPAGRAYSVLWWTPMESVSLGKANIRMKMLQTLGYGPLAFTFKNPWLDKTVFDKNSMDELLSMHLTGKET